MSAADELTDAVVFAEASQRGAEGATDRAADLIARYVAEQAGAQMSRVDALKWARDHVEAMSTNGRGYQDGVKLDDKVRAVDRFARFLMGESE